MHERGCETTTTHPLARREAVEAGDVRLEVNSASCCRRAIDRRQDEQQRAIASRTDRVVKSLPILTPSLVAAEHLAVDLMPGAKLAVRAYLDDLAVDLRRRCRRGGRCGHPVHHSRHQVLRSRRTEIARARLFGKPDEPGAPFERFGSFTRRDRARGEQLVQERVELRVQKAGQLWPLDCLPAEHRSNLCCKRPRIIEQRLDHERNPSARSASIERPASGLVRLGQSVGSALRMLCARSVAVNARIPPSVAEGKNASVSKTSPVSATGGG